MSLSTFVRGSNEGGRNILPLNVRRNAEIFPCLPHSFVPRHRCYTPLRGSKTNQLRINGDSS